MFLKIAFWQQMDTAGVLFLYVVELVKIKKKRASFSSRETLLSQKPISNIYNIKFLKNNQEKYIFTNYCK